MGKEEKVKEVLVLKAEEDSGMTYRDIIIVVGVIAIFFFHLLLIFSIWGGTPEGVVNLGSRMRKENAEMRKQLNEFHKALNKNKEDAKGHVIETIEWTSKELTTLRKEMQEADRKLKKLIKRYR